MQCNGIARNSRECNVCNVCAGAVMCCSVMYSKACFGFVPNSFVRGSYFERRCPRPSFLLFLPSVATSSPSFGGKSGCMAGAALWTRWALPARTGCRAAARCLRGRRSTLCALLACLAGTYLLSLTQLTLANLRMLHTLFHSLHLHPLTALSFPQLART